MRALGPHDFPEDERADEPELTPVERVFYLGGEQLLGTAGVATYVLVGPDVLRGYIKRGRWQ